MRNFRVGDTVFCKIRGNSLISASSGNYDVQLSFKVIGYDGSKYILHIPKYYNIKNSWNIIEEHLEKYRLDVDYLDNRAIAIFADKVARVQVQTTKEDGLFCKKCDEFFPMAEPNQTDGSLVCYQCRSNPYR